MPENLRHFIRLLIAELQDLSEDLTLIDDVLRQRFEAGEITAYVYRENDALLRRERDSITNMMKVVDGIDTSIYKDSAELEAELLGLEQHVVQSLGEPEAVVLFLKRKIDKIRSYLSSGEGTSGNP